MPTHLNRHLLAATCGLTGSAQTAGMNGRLQSHHGFWTAVDVPAAATVMVTESTASSQLLKKSNTRCCKSGIISAMLGMAYILTIPHSRATSVCIGYVTNVQRSSSTDTRCVLVIALQGDLKGAHIVLAKECDCSSLAACEPTIAAEWDFARNDGSPAGFSWSINHVVWWSNDVRGSWKEGINQRTDPRRNLT